MRQRLFRCSQGTKPEVLLRRGQLPHQKHIWRLEACLFKQLRLFCIQWPGKLFANGDLLPQKSQSYRFLVLRIHHFSIFYIVQDRILNTNTNTSQIILLILILDFSCAVISLSSKRGEKENAYSLFHSQQHGFWLQLLFWQWNNLVGVSYWRHQNIFMPH